VRGTSADEAEPHLHDVLALLQMYIRQFKEMAQKRLIPDYEAQQKPLGGPVKVEGRGTPAMPGAESASIE